MKKILITGGNGFIARNLKRVLSNDYDVTTITRQDFDLTDNNAVNEFFDGKWFDVVIHTAIVGGSRLSKDIDTVRINNIKMYLNLRNNLHHYGKFVNIGSGVELNHSSYSPYGISKRVIRDSVMLEPNFYNVRVYAVFGPDELDTRFIKANLKRYIDKEPIIIHTDKFMDFFYIDDFVKIIRYYIEESSPMKEFQCCYRKSYTLSQIAHIINECDNYTVDIINDATDFNSNYIGKFVDLDINYIGLERGIKETYKKMIE